MKDDEKPIGITPFQLFGTIITAIGVFLYYMSGFLTLREHQEFVNRFNSDLSRLDREQTIQTQNLEKRIETRQSEHDAELALNSLNSRLKLLQEQINRLSDREDKRHSEDKR